MLREFQPLAHLTRPNVNFLLNTCFNKLPFVTRSCFNNMKIKEVYSLSSYIDNFLFSQGANENIHRNIFTNKWVLKVNEKRDITTNKYFQKNVIFCVLLVFLIVILCTSFLTFFAGSDKDLVKSITPKTSTFKITVIHSESNQKNISENFNFNLNINNITDISNEFSNHSTDVNNCGVCERDEICLYLPNEVEAKCRKIQDELDPTGCGGICVLETQYCREIGRNSKVFQCVESINNTNYCQVTERNFHCGDICLSKNQICDGVINCVDRSDEWGCECNETTHFKCGDQMSCFPVSFKCNGAVDCWDAKDEKLCNLDCQDSDRFSCLNGSNCLAIEKFCDGFVDCSDESDEPKGCRSL